MTVFARGLLNRLFTRVYLPDDEAALEADACCSRCPRTGGRRWWLVATRTATCSTYASRATARPCSSAFPGA